MSVSRWWRALLRGAGSILDLGATSPRPKYKGPQDDAAAIASDWRAIGNDWRTVGDDLRRAIDKASRDQASS